MREGLTGGRGDFQENEFNAISHEKQILFIPKTRLKIFE